MFEEKIRNLIRLDDDEYHDFKLEWYTKHQKDEMIKDIYYSDLTDKSQEIVDFYSDEKKVIPFARQLEENLQKQHFNY